MFFKLVFFLVLANCLFVQVFGQKVQQSVVLDDLHVRDPFIVTDSISGQYILYKSKDIDLASGEKIGGVEAYVSKDLLHWDGPTLVYSTPTDNWIRGTVWAPEVHLYRGKYYLFLTLNSTKEWQEKKKDWPAYTYRSVQVFHADSPLGPFIPFDKTPFLPKEWMTLDGTLWVEDNKPYMVYCHEWVQVVDGRMELIELKEDLSTTVGEPKTLFHASDASWSTGNLRKDGVRSYVTDGCYVYKTKTGQLLMIWSSFNEGNYAIGIASSLSGKIDGPWIQQENLLFEKNGGHGMIFKDLTGNLYIVFHGPNSPAGSERALLFPLLDLGHTLVLANP